MKKLMKRLTGLALAAVLIVSGLAVPAGATAVTSFTDVSPEDWHYRAVEYAADNNLVNGTTPTTFSPNAPMTRGMLVTVLGRKSKIDESQFLRYRFRDVKKGDWYAPYVEWAASYGIVTGMTETTFAPNQTITREQMATMLYRYVKATGNDAGFTSDAYNKFPDTGTVSSWAREAFQWASCKGIIKGSGGKLAPKGPATRAQVAQVLFNGKDVLVNTEVQGEPTLPPDTDTEYLTEEDCWGCEDFQDPNEVIRQVAAKSNTKLDMSLDWKKDQFHVASIDTRDHGMTGTGDFWGGWTNQEAVDWFLQFFRENHVESWRPTRAYHKGFSIMYVVQKEYRGVATLTNGKPTTEENVKELLYSLQSKYPNGTPAPNCGEFAQQLTKEVFGETYVVYPDWDGSDFPCGNADFDALRPGDAIDYRTEYGVGHSVVVLEKYPDKITVVEGGVNASFVNWGREVSKEILVNNSYFVMHTAYPGGLPK